jgi:NAD(P) transhydrogenase subunit beta
MSISLLTVIYILSSVSYILGLKMLSHPETARRGNLIAAAGMTLAIIGTIFLYEDDEVSALRNYPWIYWLDGCQKGKNDRNARNG